MDINILNSGTPDSKNWLNIVCNSITTNDLILDYDIFNINFTGQSPLTANLTNPCDTTAIDSPNMDLATNVYTSEDNINLFVSLQLSLYYPAAITAFSTSVSINVNGIPSYLTTGTQNAGASVQGRYALTCTGVLSLSVGDTVSLSIISTGSVAGINYGNVSFSGYVI